MLQEMNFLFDCAEVSVGVRFVFGESISQKNANSGLQTNCQMKNGF